jgi:hypothetical protein
MRWRTRLAVDVAVGAGTDDQSGSGPGSRRASTWTMDRTIIAGPSVRPSQPFRHAPLASPPHECTLPTAHGIESGPPSNGSAGDVQRLRRYSGLSGGSNGERCTRRCSRRQRANDA